MCFMLTSAVSADVLLITDAGYWISTVDPVGIPSWRQVETVVDVRGETPTNPDTPPTETISTSVEKWTREVADPTTALGMAEVYRIGAEQLRGQLNDEQSLRLVSMLTDEVLKAQNAADKWKAWRGKVTGVVTSERQGGTFGPETFDDIEKGLRNSTDGQAINIDNLIRLLELILPILLRILGL